MFKIYLKSLKSFLASSKILMIIICFCFQENSFAQIAGDFQTKGTTGNWSDFSAWNIRSGGVWIAAVSGEIPTSTSSVFIQTGHTINVDITTAVCNDLNFTASGPSLRVVLGIGKILSIYGNLNQNANTNIPFPTFGVGAKIVFTGTANQTITNSGINTNLNNVEINKAGGIFTLPAANTRFDVFVLTAGTVSVAAGADLIGLTPLSVINVNGGTWTQTTGATRIYSGTGSPNIDLNINSGIMTLATSSAGANGFNFSTINIINGGILNLNSFTGNINITNAFNIDFNSTLNTELTITPSAAIMSFLGTVNYIKSNGSGNQNIINTIYGNIGLGGIGSKTAAANLTVTNNLTISGTAVLPLAALTATIGGNWTNYNETGFTESTSTVNFNGTGTQIINTSGGEYFYRLLKTGSGTVILNSNVEIGGGGTAALDISNGIFDASTFILFGSGSTPLIMSAGVLRFSSSRTLPEFDVPSLALTGNSTIELYGPSVQVLKGNAAYRNLTFSNSGQKLITSAPTSVTGTITIADAASLEIFNNSMGGLGTNITMTGTSKFVMAGVGTKPDARGIYTLAPTSTIEFSNFAGTQQDIRLTPDVGFVTYGNVNVSGSNVGLSGPASVLNMQPSTTFTVTNTGAFNVKNPNGFCGTTTTAINNVNSPTISLLSLSTINYNGAAQTITNTVAYQNLQFSGTGVKTAPLTDLFINGNLSRAGTHTFNANASRVVFQGTTAQTYSAAAGTSPIDFYNLSSINPQNLIVDSTFGILNELNLTTTAKLNLNLGDIIMRSSAVRTSHIIDLGITAVSANITYGTGRFFIERYLFDKKSWRYLATPVLKFIDDPTSPTITNSWREGEAIGIFTTSTYGTRITGPTGMDEYTQRPSMKSYNIATNNYDGVNAAALATPIANDAGYALFVIGDRTKGVPDAAGTTTLRIKGKIRTGDQTFPVPAGKFQSVGNPFASQIEVKKITKNSITDAIVIWDPNAPGNYNVGAWKTYAWDGANYVRTPNDFTTRNFIESGEAFFVQNSTGTSQNLVIKEADKTSGSNLVSRNTTQARLGVLEQTLEINLYAKNTDGISFLADGVKLNFDNTYSNLLDNMDVRKVSNTYDNLGIKHNNNNLVIERRPNLTESDTIRLNLTNTRIASYRFEIDPSVLSNTGLDAFLKDIFLQTETPISLSTVTNINFDITADAASRVADRFMIVFKQAPTTSFTTISATRNADKTVTVQWGTATERNVTNYTIEQSNDGINFTSMGTQVPTANNGGNPTYSKQDANASKANNWYKVKANNTNGTFKYTAIAMVGAVNEVTQIGESKISIYPNPVINGNVNLHFNSQPNGKYTVQITNAKGQIIQTETVQVQNNNTLHIIKIGTIAKGNYQTTLSDGAGNKTTLGFIVK
jgi:Secretion system C-terminal sorting domain